MRETSEKGCNVTYRHLEKTSLSAAFVVQKILDEPNDATQIVHLPY